MSSIQATGAVAPSASEFVTVARDLNDERSASVRLEQLRNPHLSTVRGGDWQTLPRPVLAAYVFCDVARGVAHSCGHGTGPHSIKVLVNEDLTPAAVLADLRERAANCRTRPRRRHRVA